MMTRSALLAATVGAAITLTACDVSVLNKSFSDEHAVPQRFTSVLIDSGSGDFTIRYKEGAAASIRRTVEHTSSNTPSGVFHTVEGEALVLRDCGNNCTINYEVTIPSKDIHLRGDLGSGDLTAEGLRAVDYRTGSGNVQIRDITQSVKIDSSSGDVTVERIGGPLTAPPGLRKSPSD